MTFITQDNQILSGVVSQLAARLQVMDFEVLHAATALASPAITRQNLSTQSEICIRLKL
jgi:hypothetical protein